MKTLYIDCSMGAAGDMLTAALTEIYPEPEKIVEELNALGIPGVRFTREASVKSGITGSHISVTVNGEEEESHDHHGHEAHPGHEHAEPERHYVPEHDHGYEPHGHAHSHTPESHTPEHRHDHEHSHTHPHHHSSLHDIEHIVRGHLSLPQKVQDDVMAVYHLIAEAESHVHGVPVTEIHFHEIGRAHV